MPIADALLIDTHAHVFHRALPLTETRRYAPDYDATLAQCLARMDRDGIAYGVLVQPSFLGLDNAYLLNCLALERDRLRGIVVIDVDTPFEEMQRLDSAGVIGARLNLLGAAPPDLTSAPWRRWIDRVNRLSWQIEVQDHCSNLVASVEPLLKRSATVVVDHYGLPDQRLGVDDPAFAQLLSLGRGGRLWFKLSAPYRSGLTGEVIAAKAFARLKDALGTDRLVWGSDWPHTRHETEQSEGAALRAFEQIVTSLDDRNSIMAAAAALCRFDHPVPTLRVQSSR